MKNLAWSSVLPFLLMVGAFSQSIQQTELPDKLPPAPEGKAWSMIWHDEFDGATLDPSKWVYRPNGQRRDGWWDQKTVGLDGLGHLVIRTIREADRYIDGCITTQGKFEHASGFYVVRIQLQQQPGHWSAFWITGPGVANVGNGGRDGAEIDIMEKPWLDDRVQHTFHWDGYGQDHQTEEKVVQVPDVMNGFHTFGLWWKADEYVFYVDGQETWRTTGGGACQVPEYILLSDEIGAWGGNIAEAKLPDRFLVDYVRVYDLSNIK
jgi:beta-glucanase (GH16 family)